MTSAHKILSKALALHKPSLIILSFSGGYDSMVSSHIATQWAKQHAHSTNVITISADTLISADGWRDFVTNTAKQLGFPRFAIHNTDHFEKWASRMIESGYVYRESQHRINFYYLKQVVFRKLVQQYKKYRTDRIMFVNGVRRAESSARQHRPEIARQGSGVFVNPILYWSDLEVEQYRIAHDMPINPFYDTIGNSGDCLCNWHTHFKKETIQHHAPQTWQKIEPIHINCQKRHGYGYGEIPRNGQFIDGAGVQSSFFDLVGINETPNLCSDCRKPAASNEQRADLLFSRMNW